MAGSEDFDKMRRSSSGAEQHSLVSAATTMYNVNQKIFLTSTTVYSFPFLHVDLLVSVSIENSRNGCKDFHVRLWLKGRKKEIMLFVSNWVDTHWLFCFFILPQCVILITSLRVENDLSSGFYGSVITFVMFARFYCLQCQFSVTLSYCMMSSL